MIFEVFCFLSNSRLTCMPREYTEARTQEANLPARRPAEIPGEDVFIPFRAMYEAI